MIKRRGTGRTGSKENALFILLGDDLIHTFSETFTSELIYVML